MSEQKPFVEMLDEDDWAIIIGANGALKGVFIPEGKDEDEVPESLVDIMQNYFGVDFDEDAPTFH